MVLKIVAVSLIQNSPWKPDLPLSSILDYLQGTEGKIQSTEFANELNIFILDLSQTLKSIQRTEITDENFSTRRSVRNLISSYKNIIIIKGA